MKPKSQKEIFINGEGDAWLKRNKREGSLNSENMQVNKFILEYLLSLPIPNSKKIKLMEVGCGDGSLLFNLKKIENGSYMVLIQAKKQLKSQRIMESTLPYQQLKNYLLMMIHLILLFLVSAYIYAIQLIYSRSHMRHIEL